MAPAQYAVRKVKADECSDARKKHEQQDKREHRQRHLEDAESQIQQIDVSGALEIACIASAAVIRMVCIRHPGMIRVMVIVMTMTVREGRLGNADVPIFVRVHVHAGQLQG